MPEYTCPNCRGGFPEPKDARGSYGGREDQCPWCGQALGDYEPDDPTEIMQEQMSALHNTFGDGPLSMDGPSIDDTTSDDLDWESDFDEEDEL